MNFNRRQFLGAAPAALAAARALHADPLGMPIGCQTWPVRADMAKDFEGTLRSLAGIGFKTIEMCSPPSYADFRPLASLTAAQMRKTIEGAGLRCESCHYQFKELKENLDERMAFARELGLKQMVLASFGLPANASLADYKKAAGELNRIGERTQKAGFQLGYHNHNNEFQELEGGPSDAGAMPGLVRLFHDGEARPERCNRFGLTDVEKNRDLILLIRAIWNQKTAIRHPGIHKADPIHMRQHFIKALL